MISVEDARCSGEITLYFKAHMGYCLYWILKYLMTINEKKYSKIKFVWTEEVDIHGKKPK